MLVANALFWWEFPLKIGLIPAKSLVHIAKRFATMKINCAYWVFRQRAWMVSTTVQVADTVAGNGSDLI